MSHLFFSVMAIALMGVIAFSASQYINPTGLRIASESRVIYEGIEDIHYTVSLFERETGRLPFRAAEFVPRKMLYPDSPFAAKSSAWSYVNTTEADDGLAYICIEGSADSATLEALRRVAKYYSPQSYFIASACGAEESNEPVIDSSSVGQMAATVWLTPFQRP